MGHNPDTARMNWRVYLVCVDCGEQFRVNSVDPSVELYEANDCKQARMAVICFPNACLRCKNIRVASGERE